MMETGCTCDIGEDRPELINYREPVARKKHRCCECGEAILPGTKYERVFGVWHGEASSFATCLTCATIRDQYGCRFGDLRTEVWQCLGLDYVTGKTIDDVDESRLR